VRQEVECAVCGISDRSIDMSVPFQNHSPQKKDNEWIRVRNRMRRNILRWPNAIFAKFRSPHLILCIPVPDLVMNCPLELKY